MRSPSTTFLPFDILFFLPSTPSVVMADRKCSNNEPLQETSKPVAFRKTSRNYSQQVHSKVANFSMALSFWIECRLHSRTDSTIHLAKRSYHWEPIWSPFEVLGDDGFRIGKSNLDISHAALSDRSHVRFLLYPFLDDSHGCRETKRTSQVRRGEDDLHRRDVGKDDLRDFVVGFSLNFTAPIFCLRCLHARADLCI